jgi:hypothetical protein
MPIHSRTEHQRFAGAIAGALLGQPLRSAEVEEHLDGLVLTLATTGHKVAFRLYTCCGVEPDPYLEVTLDGQRLFNDGDFSGFGELTLGTSSPPSVWKASVWAGHRRIENALSFGAEAPVVGLRYSHTEVLVATPDAVLGITKGMEQDFLTPAASRHFTLVAADPGAADET